MRLSTKGRYAMVAMTALALAENGGYTNLVNISQAAEHLDNLP